MGLWDWIRPGEKPEEDPHGLRDRMRDLESSMRSLELDWETTYDKVRRALATMAKREKREETAASAGEPTLGNGDGARLSPSEQGRILRELRQRRGF